MSEKAAPDTKKDGIKAYIDEMFIGVMNEMEKRDDEKRKKEFDSLMAGINAKIDPLITVVNQHTEIMNAANTQPQVAGGGKRSIGELVTELKPIVEVLQSMGVIKGPDSSVDDKLLTALKIGLQRRQNRDVIKIIGGLRKSGDLLAEESEEALSEALGQHPAPV